MKKLIGMVLSAMMVLSFAGYSAFAAATINDINATTTAGVAGNSVFETLDSHDLVVKGTYTPTINYTISWGKLLYVFDDGTNKWNIAGDSPVLADEQIIVKNNAAKYIKVSGDWNANTVEANWNSGEGPRLNTVQNAGTVGSGARDFSGVNLKDGDTDDCIIEFAGIPANTATSDQHGVPKGNIGTTTLDLGVLTVTVTAGTVTPVEPGV